MTTDSGPPAEKPAGKRTKKSPRRASDEVPAPQSVIRKVEETIAPTESKREITARLRISEQDAEHERWKERRILNALLITSGLVVLASLAVLARSDKPNLQNWATGALMTVLAGFFGYFTARQGPRK